MFFRRSDVLSTGDVFTPGSYPIIDLARGGSVEGEINALNQIIDITVPAKYQEGGTMVIPGHGRLCDEADVVEYRNMLTVIRDRFRDMIHKGMTLEQVKAAKPTLGLRRAVRRDYRILDHGHVHRRGLQEPEREKVNDARTRLFALSHRLARPACSRKAFHRTVGYSARRLDRRLRNPAQAWPRRLISPATGFRWSPKTGAGAW